MQHSEAVKTFSKTPQESSYRTIPCPLCGARNSSIVWRLEGYSFSRCGNCGALFQNPQPKADELIERYDEEYFSYEIENEEQYLELMLKGLNDIDFFTKVEAELEKEKLPKRFLDIGCATGKLIAYMKERGWQEKGVEVCIPAAEFAREQRKVDVFSGTIEEAQLPEASYSVIHASHLIEHLNDPKAFVSSLYNLLLPGGYAVIATPNSSGLQAKLFGGYWRSAIADHMVLFSKKHLRRLLEEEGFELRKTKTWGGIAKGLAPAAIKAPVDRLVKIFGWGDVMIMLAKKPAFPS